MKQKYYMRGLGIGVLITTIVFTWVILLVRNNMTLSDDDIYKKAIELGYVNEKNTSQELNISELNSKLTPIPTPKISEDSDETKARIASEEVITPVEDIEGHEGIAEDSSGVEDASLSEISEADNTVEDAENTENVVTTNKAKEEDVTVRITVKSGMTSEQVCRMLEQNGIVESATEIGKYFIVNGLTNQINVGNFDIRKGETFENIGKILTAHN